ncbi:MAG TPA: zinc ribbon domain-containing protein [Dehalococcoidia bacterium]|nr:zinc ribbon domain-containing protein [Dehalococcoidia bacterium]
MPVCSHCGKEVSEGIKFCPECGERLKKEFTPEEKEKYTQELEASVEKEKPAEKPKRTKSQLAGGIVGSIVAIIIIIAAISTCIPSETPSLTASEQNYAATMADHSGRVSEALGNMADLMGNPQFFDDEWIMDVAIEFTVIKLLYDEALEMEPPSSMAAIHYKYTQAMSHLNSYVDLMTEGIDTLDADLMDQATSELELAGEYLNEATELTEDFIAARSP